MGIKFHCPKGHKLNVKAFLAGKKGVCPKCGTKLRIPAASEPGLDGDLEETDATHGEAVKSNGSGAIAAAKAPQTATAEASSAATATADDPIAEAPAAIWYVRPPTGGQYGPARGEVMRKWLAEGRVSSDGKLFPTIGAAGSAASAPPQPNVSTTVPLSPRSSQRAAARYETKKHDNTSMAIAILAGLGVVCVVLIGVLVYVVLNLK
jgi:hypothetical protein